MYKSHSNFETLDEYESAFEDYTPPENGSTTIPFAQELEYENPFSDNEIGDEEAEEDYAALRQILENLMYLSFEQEKVMNEFKTLNNYKTHELVRRIHPFEPGHILDVRRPELHRHPRGPKLLGNGRSADRDRLSGVYRALDRPRVSGLRRQRLERRRRLAAAAQKPAQRASGKQGRRGGEPKKAIRRHWRFPGL